MHMYLFNYVQEYAYMCQLKTMRSTIQFQPRPAGQILVFKNSLLLLSFWMRRLIVCLRYLLTWSGLLCLVLLTPLGKCPLSSLNSPFIYHSKLCSLTSGGAWGFSLHFGWVLTLGPCSHPTDFTLPPSRIPSFMLHLIFSRLRRRKKERKEREKKEGGRVVYRKEGRKKTKEEL